MAVTSRVEQIVVICPECGHRYEDWYRPSINLQLDDFDEEYLQEATSATCPQCGTRVDLPTLIVDKEGVWHVPAQEMPPTRT